MSKKGNERPQSCPVPERSREELVKGQVSEKLYSENPVREGYQPTNKLDTSNPPSNSGGSEKK